MNEKHLKVAICDKFDIQYLFENIENKKSNK